MKVLVAIKRVADGNAPAHIKPDGSAIDLTHTPMRINPFDEAALEWAIQEKEAGRISEIVAVSLGDSACQDTLRHALALGADRAIRIDYAEPTQPLFIARQLHALALQEKPGLMLLGKQSSDSGSAQVGPMLAALLGWPQGLYASSIVQQDTQLIITREIEGGQERLSLSLPAVVTADLRLSTPRFLKLQHLLQAKKKPIELLAVAIQDKAPAISLLGVTAPPRRRPARRTRSATELLDWLQNEGLQGEIPKPASPPSNQEETRPKIGHALILAEHDEKTLHPSASHMVTAAQKLAGRISIILAGQHLTAVARQAASIAGVTQVLVAQAEHLQHQAAEYLAPILSTALQEQAASVLIAAATPFGKAILPRTAGLLESVMCTDVVAIHSPDIFVSPIYAGEILARMQNTSPTKILTVRTSAFSHADQQKVLAPVTTQSLPPLSRAATWLGITSADSTHPALNTAKIIVTGGGGLQSAEHFQCLLPPLANQMHAALGATLAAVDAGFISNDHQIGQTGATVAPDFYFAIGLSGATQHLAGMRDSRTIIAINKDPDAPICQHADYVLEGDLFETVPELLRAMQSATKHGIG